MFFEGDIHRTVPEAQTTTLMFNEDALGFVLYVHKHAGFVCLILAVIISYFLDLYFLMFMFITVFLLSSHTDHACPQ